MQEVGDLGITLVGKNSRIPDGFRVGRNVVLGTDLRDEHFAEFPDKHIPPGTELVFE
jgi:hypothetical protein